MRIIPGQHLKTIGSNSSIFTDATKPTPKQYGTGPIWIDGAQYYSDGVSKFVSLASGVSSTTYNGDGTVASATVGIIPYTFTYSGGKLATVVGNGQTRTFTWSGDQLVSIVVT